MMLLTLPEAAERLRVSPRSLRLIQFFELELPGYLSTIIPGLMRGKGMFWDEKNWAPRP